AFSRGDGDGTGGGARSRVADLNAVVRYVTHARRYALETRGVQVRLELATGPLFVAADRAQLEQVVLNLVSNAEQALEPMADVHAHGGGSAPAVTVRTTRRGGLAVVEVADNGPGIAPADLLLV